MVTLPCAVIALHSGAPAARAGCRSDVPAAIVGLTALPPAALERRSVGPAKVTLDAFPPAIRTGGAIAVPSIVLVAEMLAPDASEIRPRQKRSVQSFSFAPSALPPSWEPWMTDGTAFVIVEEREYIDTWESIAETAISEAPGLDILSARIPLVDVHAHAPAVRGGGSVAVPPVSISVAASAPQGIGRPRAPIIQIIAS